MSAFILRNIPDTIPEDVQIHAEIYHNAYVSYVTYIETHGDIVVQRTFAYQQKSGKPLLIKEIMRWQTGSDTWLARNMLEKYYGGYTAILEKKNRYSCGCLVFSAKDDYDKWYEETCSHFNVPIFEDLNTEVVASVDKYKYSGYVKGDVVDYLKLWEEHPCVEFFSKAKMPLKPSLIKKAEKDKTFCKFLLRNSESVARYGPEATLRAYREHIGIKEACDKCAAERRFRYDIKYAPAIRNTLAENALDRERLKQYVVKNGIRINLYNDYIDALVTLGLDLTDDKNVFPKDFMRMHDLRTMEIASVKAKADRKKRAKLYKSFATAAERCQKFIYQDGGYKIIIPRDITDLVVEGEVLNHCVGRMGYDKKMADGKCVIAFVRRTEEPEMPFVTVEYSLSDKRILQQYGRSNTRPSEEVLAFTKKWSSYMSRTLLKEEKSKEMMAYG